MHVIEQKVFDTYDEGNTYMEALAKKLRADGFMGKLHLKIDNMGGKPVVFTLKGSD